MKKLDEIMDELKRMSLDMPIIFRGFEMQRVNKLDDNYTLAAMALCLAHALKDSREKQLDAEMRAWPRVIL